jgi:RimJ/RimL family protein N-acetyltransferase
MRRELTMAVLPITALPLLGLRITAGPVELRGITDDLLEPMARLAIEGIHDPDYMPFVTPWSLTPAEQMPLAFAQYHWGVRSRFAVEKWSADLAVSYDGELVGTQGISTSDYLVTRTGETGSWLARKFHGRGIGTAMRQVMCAFVFDHLGARSITSAAYADNPASLGVSRKVGYAENGIEWRNRMGQPVTLVRLLLEPRVFVRYEHPLTVEGLSAFRRSIGLEAIGLD